MKQSTLETKFNVHDEYAYLYSSWSLERYWIISDVTLIGYAKFVLEIVHNYNVHIIIHVNKQYFYVMSTYFYARTYIYI